MKSQLLKLGNMFLKYGFSTTKRSIYLLLFLTIFVFTTYGNDKKNDYKQFNKIISLSNSVDIVNQLNNNSWVLDMTINNVAFYHKIIICNNQKAVLLKFDNKNNFDVEVSWMSLVGSNQTPNPNQEYAKTQSLIIKPGISEPNDCLDNTIPELILLQKDVNPTFPAEVESFNFLRVKITELN